MDGYEFLLLLLFIGAVGFAIAGAAVRDVRWVSLAVGCVAAAFLAQLVNSM